MDVLSFELNLNVFPYFVSLSVGDGAYCARAKVKDLCHEGGERAAIGRAPGANQTEDQARVEGQGPAGRAGRQQRTEGTEASHLRHSAHVMLHQQNFPSPFPAPSVYVETDSCLFLVSSAQLIPVTSWEERN